VMERDLVLLGVLRRGPMHGYRIAELVVRELGGALELKRSTTYYLLERLAKDGYLRRDRVAAGKGRFASLSFYARISKREGMSDSGMTPDWRLSTSSIRLRRRRFWLEDYWRLMTPLKR